MKKNKIILIIVLMIIVGAALGIWYKGKEADKNIKELENQIDSSLMWNPYANEYSYLHTLSDFVISASNGEYILKMTVTLNFDGEENYLKFVGNSNPDDEAVTAEGVLTPMEFIINDTIGELMMKAGEEELLDKNKLKTYLMNGINKKIDTKSPLLKDVYIENYVVQ